MSCTVNPHQNKTRRRAARNTILGCETLEARLVLSHGSASAVLGTITGKVENASSQIGIAHVKVQLINAQGKVSQTTYTNSVGNYAFPITKAGAYVVHEVSPKGYAQLTPNAAKSAPTGSFSAAAGPTSATQSASWNYTSSNSNPAVGPVGPAYWSDIAPAASEPFESPIDVKAKPINLDSVLKVSYATSTPADIVNNSHQIQVQYTGTNAADFIVAGGTTFNLAQFHYHAPAETTVGGKAYAMEEHFVNTSSAGAESVVTVFLQLGKHNDALDPILSTALAHLTQPNTKTTSVSPVDFSGLLPQNHQGWFYTGSLTTPPVSQPVNWFVFKTPITLDARQLGAYDLIATQGGFLPNAREVQPLDGRVVNQYNADVNFTGKDVGGQSFGLIGN